MEFGGPKIKTEEEELLVEESDVVEVTDETGDEEVHEESPHAAGGDEGSERLESSHGLSRYFMPAGALALPSTSGYKPSLREEQHRAQSGNSSKRRLYNSQAVLLDPVFTKTKSGSVVSSDKEGNQVTAVKATMRTAGNRDRNKDDHSDSEDIEVPSGLKVIQEGEPEIGTVSSVSSRNPEDNLDRSPALEGSPDLEETPLDRLDVEKLPNSGSSVEDLDGKSPTKNLRRSPRKRRLVLEESSKVSPGKRSLHMKEQSVGQEEVPQTGYPVTEAIANTQECNQSLEKGIMQSESSECMGNRNQPSGADDGANADSEGSGVKRTTHEGAASSSGSVVEGEKKRELSPQLACTPTMSTVQQNAPYPIRTRQKRIKDFFTSDGSLNDKVSVVDIESDESAKRKSDSEVVVVKKREKITQRNEKSPDRRITRSSASQASSSRPRNKLRKKLVKKNFEYLNTD